jgi:hypothetical protein
VLFAVTRICHVAVLQQALHTPWQSQFNKNWLNTTRLYFGYRMEARSLRPCYVLCLISRGVGLSYIPVAALPLAAYWIHYVELFNKTGKATATRRASVVAVVPHPKSIVTYSLSEVLLK